MSRLIRLLSLSTMMLSAGVGGAPAGEEVTLDALQLSPQAWALRINSPISNPTTLAVLHGTTAVLVDASLIDGAPLIDAWLRERGIQRVSHVATTHYHADHTQGLEYFAARGAEIIATSAQRRRLATQGLLSEDGPPLAKYALPRVLVDGRLELSLGEETLELFTASVKNSHTDGDLFARLVSANVVYLGDHLVAHRFPVVDLDSGGSLRGYLGNLHELIAAADPHTRFVAGHGSFAPQPPRTYDRAELEEWRSTLLATIELIRTMRAQGLTLEQAQTKGLPKRYAALSQRPRFVRESAWIEVVYRSLDGLDQIREQEPGCTDRRPAGD